ncbi:Arabinose metabolism transcriptional repressor [Limihaloglobus sulfuriphilus]|uniref:Arabinose metabolism transcriptional repressor n=1 Tax=Limihaloglobus sulfuriphilus TaxID=1851148 RepID=A0A1Q2MDU6_9BACT|nr:GntR family transcriptional regulator [Limihaloglobus sulfuriphilus]AQQ70865.1 Arabinose metabolism transcriptional repressor [Limihaloglobus sulfuriphilus]
MPIDTIEKEKLIKHKLISDKLAEKISRGEYAPGDKIPTELELSRIYKASRPTVSKALRRLQRQGLVSRRQGAGSFVSYPENETKGRKVGLLASIAEKTLHNGIFGSLITEMSHYGSERGFSLLVNSVPPDNDIVILKEYARRNCMELIRQKVDAVVFMPLDLNEEDIKINEELAKSLKESGAIVVLLDRDLNPSNGHSDFDIIETNNRRGGFDIIEHLIESGCRKIDIVTVIGLAPSSVNERIEGGRRAMAKHGLSWEDLRLHKIDPRRPESCFEYLDRLDADGIMCTNDTLAAILMREMLGRGIKIPEEIKLTGFDDSPIAAYLPVPLTTMRQPVDALAAEAIRAIESRSSNRDMPARQILLSSELIVRKSTSNIKPDKTKDF